MESKNNSNNKLMEKEMRLVVTRGRGWRRGNQRKRVKSYKLAVKRLMSLRDVMYDIVTTGNTTVGYIGKALRK